MRVRKLLAGVGAGPAARWGRKGWAVARYVLPRWRLWSAPVLVLVLAIALPRLLDRSNGDGTAAPTPAPSRFLGQDEAVAIAHSRAAGFGMRGKPKVTLARRLRFGDYALLAGNRHAAIYGYRDVAPDETVWVVSMLGEVDATLLAGERVSFDNMTIVIDAEKHDVLRAVSFYDAYESAVRIPPWFTGNEPCRPADRGVLRQLFRSTCPQEGLDPKGP